LSLEPLLTITLNTKNTTRIRQTKYIKAIAEATTRAKVSIEALEVVVTLGTIIALAEAEAKTKTKAIVDKRSALYIKN
jgi:alkanesulfonate monooxygenase SsuD/methylene tetrahydromethanopterin reductase-like flavin-dependent oxidoreductase (luciferase family)